MDMWPAFINATLEMVPDAEEKVAFEKFHVRSTLAKRSTRSAARNTKN